MPEKEKNIIQPTAFDAPAGTVKASGFKWRWQHSAALVGAIIVIMVLVFMISARALMITTNAETANITLSGGTSLSMGGDGGQRRYLLLKGSYELLIKAAGYHPQSHTLDVNADTPANLSFELKPLPGQLRVKFAMGEEVLGVVRLNGTGMGPAKEFLFRDLEAGSYELQAQAYLYTPKTLQVEVSGRELTDEILVELEPDWGYLEMDVSPAEIEVFAGNELLAYEDNQARIQSGRSRLKISAPGFKDWQQSIEIEKDQRLQLGDIALEPVDSQIQIVTEPANASVTVNGMYMGQSPITLDLLPNTRHQIQLFKAGFARQAHSLTVERDSAETKTFQLTADLVDVNISVSPSNARVYVGERLAGTGSQKLPLTAIKHEIRVEAEGYASKTVEFLPIKGSRQLLQVQLLTNEQALWANTPSQYKGLAGHDMLLFKEPGLVPMGSSRREPGRRANEVEWTASLERPFYVSSKETTNEQYRLFESDHSSGHYETHGLDGPDRPAVNMTWQKAALFCNWLSEKSGLKPFYQTTKGFVSGVNPESTGYRLPTEAEWAFLAKMTPSGLPQKYSWGDTDEMPSIVENYADQSIANKINFVLEGVNDKYPVSAPVGSFPPNAKGIYDIGGNVMEWVNDWYQPVPYETKEPVIDPLGPNEGEFRVIRGASWARGYLPQLRLSYRDYDSKGRNDLGFRVARYAM